MATAELRCYLPSNRPASSSPKAGASYRPDLVQVKREVAYKNSTFKISNVEKLMNEAIDRVTAEDGVKCERHAEKLQQEDFEKECNRISILEPPIINLRDSDRENEDDSCESNEESSA